MANQEREPYVLDFPNGQRVEDILKKADADYSKAEIDAKMASKATVSDVQRETQNLQNQINEIVRAPESGGDVAAEVAQARVDADGVSHATLKARCDSDASKTTQLKEDLGELEDGISVLKTTNKTGVLESNKYISSSGIVTNVSGENNKVETIEILDEKILYITAGAGWGSCLYAFYDTNGNVIEKKQSDSDSYNRLSFYRVVVPMGATSLSLSKLDISVLGVDVFDCYEPKEKKEVDSLKALYETYYLDYGQFEPYKYIKSSNGAPTTTSSVVFLVNSINVEEGEEYKVKCYANWGNGFYSILGDDNSLISIEKSENNETEQVLEKTITIPRNAKILNISGIYNFRYSCKKKYFGITNMKSFINKKWTCIGDSLTENNSKTTKHYFDYVSENNGISIVNLGISGSGYMNGAGSNKQFYNRVDNIPLDSDVVTIFGSGNDNQLPLGSVSDNGTDTVCGCINKTIDMIIARIPTVSLGIVSPTPWESYPPYLTTDNKMSNMVSSMKQICENRSIPFLDLYHCSNLRPWTEEGRNACYTKDNGNGVHPDENGHKLIAPRFKAFLETLIM